MGASAMASDEPSAASPSQRKEGARPAATPAPRAAHAAAEAQALAVAPWAEVDAAVQYEYLDHTADVQVHSWGASLEVAFEQQVVGVMGMITELSQVSAEGGRREVSAEGHDLYSLLYNFLDEWLFQFNSGERGERTRLS